MFTYGMKNDPYRCLRMVRLPYDKSSMRHLLWVAVHKLALPSQTFLGLPHMCTCTEMSCCNYSQSCNCWFQL